MVGMSSEALKPVVETGARSSNKLVKVVGVDAIILLWCFGIVSLWEKWSFWRR